MKKMLSLTLFLFASLFLISCGPEVQTTAPTVPTISTTTTTTFPSATTSPSVSVSTTTTTTRDEEAEAMDILHAAASGIVIPGSQGLEEDFFLPSEIGEVSVSWSTEHPQYLDLGALYRETPESVGVFPVSVNRSSLGDVTAFLDGHFEYGSYSYDHQFSLVIKQEAGLTIYPTISALLASAELENLVQVTGYVYSLCDLGYFLVDASGVALGVYTTAENTAKVEIGDEIAIKGTYVRFETQFHVSNLSKQTILSRDNAVGMVTTIFVNQTDLLSQDASQKALHGHLFDLTVTLKETGTGEDAVLSLFVGSVRIANVYGGSDAASLQALRGFLNQEITLTVLYYALPESGIPWVTFYGTADDIEPTLVSDEEKLASDIAALTLPAAAKAGAMLSLPVLGANGSVISWTAAPSGSVTLGEGNIVFDGDIVSETVILTATLTYGALEPEEKTFQIAVTGAPAIAVIRGMASGTATQARGTVYLLLEDGFLIQDETGYLAIRTGSAPEVALGDRVLAEGTLAAIGNSLRLASVSSLITLSEGAKIIPPSVPWAASPSLVPGTLYRITATIKQEGTANLYYLYDGAQKIGVIAADSPASAITALSSLVGTTVSLEAYYLHTAADANAEGTLTAVFAYDDFLSSLTDQERAERDLSELLIDPEGFLNRIVYYPVEGYYGSGFAYASDVPAAAAFTPVAGIYYGVSALYSQCTSIQVTVTATKGSATAAKAFPVTITELSVTPLGDIGEEDEGILLYAEGTVVAFNGTAGFFLQDPVTKAGLYVQGSLSGLSVGNGVVIKGTVQVNASAGTLPFVFLGGDIKAVWNDYGNTATVYVEAAGTDLSGLLADPALLGKYLSLTQLTIAKYEGGRIWFLLGNSGGVDVYLKAAYSDPVLPDARPAGTVLSEVKMIVFRPAGTDYEVLSLTMPALTDAEKLAADAAKLEAAVTVTTEFALPEPTFGTYTNIVISAGLSSALSWNAGTFTLTQPLAGSGDAVGDVSFTLTVGSASSDHTVHVTVEAQVAQAITDLFISEYVEGSSYNKYIEIYNGTGHAVDLSAYTLELYSNGSATASTTLTLSGTLNSGCVVVLHHASAALSYSNPTGIDIIDSTVINFNGDDALVLKHNGTVIDAIGKIGERPATGYWGTTSLGTKDCTLVRNPSVTAGRTDAGSAFDPSLEWIGYPIDTPTYLGSHTIE